jgi:hypothetical protein
VIAITYLVDNIISGSIVWDPGGSTRALLLALSSAIDGNRESIYVGKSIVSHKQIGDVAQK